MHYRTSSVLIIFVLITLCSCADDSKPIAKPTPEPTSKKSVTPTSFKKEEPTNDSGSEFNSSKMDIAMFSNDSLSVNASKPLKSDSEGVFTRLGLDTGAVKRTFYVVATLTGIVLLYFTFKGISTLRRRRRKPRRYGLLADTKEMRRFRDAEEEEDSDDGDEDATLFDARKHNNHRGS